MPAASSIACCAGSAIGQCAAAGTLRVTSGVAVLQLLPADFGSWNTKPVWRGVSTKSTVTRSSSRRLSAGRNSLTPSISNTPSPGLGAASTENSAASPEQPPGVTDRRRPLPGPPSKRSSRRKNVCAAGVSVMSIAVPSCRPSGPRLVARDAGVDDAGVVHRADGDALRHVEVADALGAFLRVDDERPVLLRNRDVRAFGLAGGARRALRGDDLVGHGIVAP